MMDKERAEWIWARYALAIERIREIAGEEVIEGLGRDYFQKTAGFLVEMDLLLEMIEGKRFKRMSLSEMQELNRELYRDILPEHYDHSYANPAYAAEKLGAEYGSLLCFLYTELRGAIPCAFEMQAYDEERLLHMVILYELFLQVYAGFTDDPAQTPEEIRQMIYWHMSDYSDVLVPYRIRQQLDPSLDFATDIILHSQLMDLRYLYRYGEYISDNELKLASYLNSLSQEKIDAMALTYTDGYRVGFVNTGKDISKKSVVNIRYPIGFERVVRSAIRYFEDMGLKPAIYRIAYHSVNKRQNLRIGYCATSPNKQYDYDHKDDAAVYLDKKYVTRKLEVTRQAFEEYKELAYGHAGPACIEVFGEAPFTPENKPAACRLTDKQQKLMVYCQNEAGQITNEYIKGDERSFTIIAFPLPEIGKDFPEIFDEIVRINTLDYVLYQTIQQKLIDALDGGAYVHILGAGANETDLQVALKPLADTARETVFENCVADVNIPVGEVFTSPVLKGTDGILHVGRVYLNELEYRGLRIAFKDGCVSDYTCTNFDNEEENKKYIRENVLYHHDSLPMGEFAIGTNTAAYVMARRYRIEDKLPILIAEKMGPHFAVGDTCYSWEEDTKTYNPDGKEIIAKENEISALRKEDISKAYFNCHTDITIPYDELAEIAVVYPDGGRCMLIRDGRFVLAGTEKLNEPFGA
ncbi:aminopeptidase [Diplocloster modestus]|uniref:Aminopeptidase n=1 Tax=Diplocloster modestus TaxID=2850322 RepID=A0ABS6KDV0_9FIRM|nr:aminopeptidase [Diplocloster modestus]MBU9728688.1 aminopeptidase [Diplocloster modestus]